MLGLRLSARRDAAGLSLLLCLIAAVSCSEPESLNELKARVHPTDYKVLLIGIDGAKLSIIEYLSREGKVPEFTRLIEGGVSGNLESDDPMLSPCIWTTIATGKDRKDHGITNFFTVPKDDPDKKVLVQSNDRKVTAIWNWLGAFDKEVGFQGWWASWPAEPVNGWIISDRVPRSRWSEWTDGSKETGLTYPPELIEELTPLIVDPDNPPMDEVNHLVSLTRSEIDEFNAAKKPIFAHWLSNFKFSFCAQRTYENIATHMLAKGQPDLTGVFLIANDSISHTFWHFYRPDDFDGVDEATADRLGALVPNFYIHNDQYIAKLLSEVDPDTVVFIVSDHGFQSSGELPHQVSSKEFDELREDAQEKGVVNVGQPGIHEQNGTFIAFGPPIKQGIVINDASVFDIAPTILATMGLPVADDMDGRVLDEIFVDGFLDEHPVTKIHSYEDYFERVYLDVNSDDYAAQTMEHLRSLGYLK